MDLIKELFSFFIYLVFTHIIISMTTYGQLFTSSTHELYTHVIRVMGWIILVTHPLKTPNTRLRTKKDPKMTRDTK